MTIYLDRMVLLKLTVQKTVNVSGIKKNNIHIVKNYFYFLDRIH